jgi:hypothetical protein
MLALSAGRDDFALGIVLVAVTRPRLGVDLVLALTAFFALVIVTPLLAAIDWDTKPIVPANRTKLIAATKRFWIIAPPSSFFLGPDSTLISRIWRKDGVAPFFIP